MRLLRARGEEATALLDALLDEPAAIAQHAAALVARLDDSSLHVQIQARLAMHKLEPAAGHALVLAPEALGADVGAAAISMSWTRSRMMVTIIATVDAAERYEIRWSERSCSGASSSAATTWPEEERHAL